MQGTSVDDKETKGHEDKINKAHENKRARGQDNKISKTTRETYNMMTTKKDTKAVNSRTREPRIKERVHENKGTRDKRTKSSVWGL